MNQYRITAIITKTTDCLDAGAWQMSMGWRKTLVLNPADADTVADLRERASMVEGTEAETLWNRIREETERQSEAMKEKVRGLVNLLNAAEPALDEQGYPLWDRGYALHNSTCWQWQLVCAHSSDLVAIMRRAGIDDWPPSDNVPDVANAEITINLSIQ